MEEVEWVVTRMVMGIAGTIHGTYDGVEVGFRDCQKLSMSLTHRLHLL